MTVLSDVRSSCAELRDASREVLSPFVLLGKYGKHLCSRKGSRNGRGQRYNANLSYRVYS